ncbi:hypothetical protein GYMLUDRAFT_41885 [Collybiopsis luxurians FD-317 M1]|uniref:Uncharacterized protein n=1 Tax=Collybiopsis luxurians FD-317 M1 TaxID=944289 RepID=A0A0D0CIE4_9AGAR|nr:hypothetical protein GYMLUDRAFT_41885 [Collybiopsis luxurians FD-317 M1]
MTQQTLHDTPLNSKRGDREMQELGTRYPRSSGKRCSHTLTPLLSMTTSTSTTAELFLLPCLSGETVPSSPEHSHIDKSHASLTPKTLLQDRHNFESRGRSKPAVLNCIGPPTALPPEVQEAACPSNANFVAPRMLELERQILELRRCGLELEGKLLALKLMGGTLAGMKKQREEKDVATEADTKVVQFEAHASRSGDRKGFTEIQSAPCQAELNLDAIEELQPWLGRSTPEDGQNRGLQPVRSDNWQVELTRMINLHLGAERKADRVKLKSLVNRLRKEKMQRECSCRRR